MLPLEPTLGGRINVRLACFTLSSFDALLDGHVERGYAVEPVADAASKVTWPWSAFALLLTRSTSGKPSGLAIAVARNRGNTRATFV